MKKDKTGKDWLGNKNSLMNSAVQARTKHENLSTVMVEITADIPKIENKIDQTSNLVIPI